jgi:hypothetical protein
MNSGNFIGQNYAGTYQIRLDYRLVVISCSIQQHQQIIFMETEVLPLTVELLLMFQVLISQLIIPALSLVKALTEFIRQILH